MSVPVLSTSHVYTGRIDTGRDIDMDGLQFCDMPWLLDDDSGSDQSEQIIPIGSPLLDDVAARVALSLTIPANAVSASIRIRPAANGAAIPDSPFGNVLILKVEGA